MCIWALADQTKLSNRVKEILENGENGFFVSKMSFFEIAIKLKIGKLPAFNVPLNEFIDASYRSGFNTLSIKDDHFKSYLEMDFTDDHRDPFDRYLLAAAHCHDASIDGSSDHDNHPLMRNTVTTNNRFRESFGYNASSSTLIKQKSINRTSFLFIRRQGLVSNKIKSQYNKNQSIIKALHFTKDAVAMSFFTLLKG